LNASLDENQGPQNLDFVLNDPINFHRDQQLAVDMALQVMPFSIPTFVLFCFVFFSFETRGKMKLAHSNSLLPQLVVCTTNDLLYIKKRLDEKTSRYWWFAWQ
jgi:hypothetical protein